ncbi:MAG TPA: ComEC/Rec2 family competence protein, partial [Isosphaeraceae bacterium]|nr:ComEC/Rec2 family competence protein [Isosphaeraceae bacterium]
MDGTAAILPDGVVVAPGSDAGSTLRSAGDRPASAVRTRTEGAPFWCVPLAPVVAAVALGIVVDRFDARWGTPWWAVLTLVGGMVALAAMRRAVLSSLALLVACCAIGGGWHHSRWWDRSGDDLASFLTETPRAAWLRGAIRDELGTRPSDRSFYGAGLGVEATGPSPLRARFVIDVAAIRDGPRWRPVSGRAMLLVAGGRSEIRAGDAVEVIGQLARIPGPLNPGEFDYRGFLRGQGIDLRLTVNDPSGLDRDPSRRHGFFARGLGRLRAWSRSRLVDGLDPET